MSLFKQAHSQEQAALAWIKSYKSAIEYGWEHPEGNLHHALTHFRRARALYKKAGVVALAESMDRYAKEVEAKIKGVKQNPFLGGLFRSKRKEISIADARKMQEEEAHKIACSTDNYAQAQRLLKQRPAAFARSRGLRIGSGSGSGNGSARMERRRKAKESFKRREEEAGRYVEKLAREAEKKMKKKNPVTGVVVINANSGKEETFSSLAAAKSALRKRGMHFFTEPDEFEEGYFAILVNKSAKDYHESNGSHPAYEISYKATKKNPRKWIAGTIKRPGALHRKLGIAPGRTIPPSLVKQAKAHPERFVKGAPAQLRLEREANEALELESFRKRKRNPEGFGVKLAGARKILADKMRMAKDEKERELLSRASTYAMDVLRFNPELTSAELAKEALAFVKDRRSNPTHGKYAGWSMKDLKVRAQSIDPNGTWNATKAELDADGMRSVTRKELVDFLTKKDRGTKENPSRRTVHYITSFSGPIPAKIVGEPSSSTYEIEITKTKGGYRKGERLTVPEREVGYLRVIRGSGGKMTTTPVPRKSNPDCDTDARKLYADFHGKTAKNVTTVTATSDLPSTLTQLGELTEVTLGSGSVLSFDGKGFRLCSNPKGTQLYITGRADFSDSDLRDFDTTKDLIDLGPLRYVVYRTRKGFDKFEQCEYSHKLGEESGDRPTLIYDKRNHRLLIAGGNYRVRPEGIVD